MGNGHCCYASPIVVLDDLVMEDDVNGRSDIFTEYFNPPLVQDFFLGKQSTKKHCWGRNQRPKRTGSLYPVEQYSELVDNDIKNSAFDEGGDHYPEYDGNTNDSISGLEDPPIVTSENDGMRNDENYCQANDHISFKSIVRLEDEMKKVIGAGSTSANGVYRWFAAHGRFVMFTDEGQYQIRGGVNLSAFDDQYYNSWVIEEYKERLVPLYAVASNNSSTSSSNGWICIKGVPPAPKVEIGDERELYEEDGSMEVEESVSIYPMLSGYLPKSWDDTKINDLS